MIRIGALILLLAAASARAQSATLTVQVRDAVTKAPLPNVEFKLLGGGTLLLKSEARTGGDGSAQFEHLPAGTFYVDFQIPGYLDSRLSGGRSAQLKDGGSETLTILLSPSTSLEGTVLDEDGRPMPGVIVRAQRPLFGGLSFAAGNEAPSDHAGRYRIEHLSAGAAGISFRVPNELRRKTLSRDPETGETFGYAAIEYYPGVADPRAATSIPVAAGLDLRGYDVRLRRVRLTELSGRMLARADGEPLASAHVELQTPNSNSMTDETFQPRAVGSDGSFRFELIEPGSYVLLIYRGEGGTGLPYIIPVEVAKTGVKNKDFVVPPFPRIEGVVKAKGGEAWSGEVALTIGSKQKGVSNRYVTVKQEHFALDDIPPGEWTILAESRATLPSIGKKLIVNAARFGLADPLSGPITVTESGNPPFEIELSSDTGRIAGTVSGPARFGIVVPRTGAGMSVQMNSMTQFKIRGDGTFLVEDLAPGRYDVMVLGGRAPTAHADVKSGETTVVRLEVK